MCIYIQHTAHYQIQSLLSNASPSSHSYVVTSSYVLADVIATKQTHHKALLVKAAQTQNGATSSIRVPLHHTLMHNSAGLSPPSTRDDSMLGEQSIKKMTLSRPLNKKEDPFSSSSSSSASASVQAVPQFHPELLEVAPAWKALLSAILRNLRVGCERAGAIKLVWVGKWQAGAADVTSACQFVRISIATFTQRLFSKTMNTMA